MKLRKMDSKNSSQYHLHHIHICFACTFTKLRIQVFLVATHGIFCSITPRILYPWLHLVCSKFIQTCTCNSPACFSFKLYRNMPDLTIQGPNGKIITLEYVDEVVEYLLQDQHVVPNSVQSSTSKAKRKKNKEASSIEEANASQQLHYTLTEAKMSSKKKKKTMAQGSLANGHHTSDNEETEGNGHFKDRSKVNILNGKIVGLRRRAGETLNCLSTWKWYTFKLVN